MNKTTRKASTTRTTRKAIAVDPAIKTSNLRRLRRIEGQVRGIQKMVEGGRYCADILMQISSIQQALQGVSRELMRNHLHHCAAHAARRGTRDSARKVYDEIIDLMYRHV
jgi:DNA-binding FrmR family transcriptional regulator